MCARSLADRTPAASMSGLWCVLLSSWPTDPAGLRRVQCPHLHDVLLDSWKLYFMWVRPLHSSGTVWSPDQRHCQCLWTSFCDTESAITFGRWQNGRWDSTWNFLLVSIASSSPFIHFFKHFPPSLRLQFSWWPKPAYQFYGMSQSQEI